MRNPKMIKRISVKCMAAIMGAAAVMSPATAAMGIVIEADAATYNTTEDIEEVNGERNLASGDTLATNPEGNTIHNNAGTITTNNGTVEVNYGSVTGGQVGDNYGTAEHAQISDNYGTASNSSVTNNYVSGSVTGDSQVTNNYGGSIQNPTGTTTQYPAYSGPNPLPTPPAPQPSGDSGDGDDPAPAPSPQPVDNPGGDSPSMGSLTVLPSETPTIQQEEKTFVNTLNSEMAKLGDMSASAASGPAGQQTINVNMGANNSYTSGMIDALEKATDQNVAVAMAVSENGKHMTFTVPADSDYSAVDSYFEQTGSTSEGYRMIQSLVSGSAIEDASGNRIVNTTDTDTLKTKADADAILYGIDYSATIVAGGGFHGSMDDLASWNNPGAAFAITSGGTAIDTTVNGGGSQTASGDIATSAIAINGGSQTEIGRIHTGEAVVASGTLPDTASQRGTFAVTDNRSVLIANAQGVFLASKGSIQMLE